MLEQVSCDILLTAPSSQTPLFQSRCVDGGYPLQNLDLDYDSPWNHTSCPGLLSDSYFFSHQTHVSETEKLFEVVDILVPYPFRLLDRIQVGNHFCLLIAVRIFFPICPGN